MARVGVIRHGAIGGGRGVGGGGGPLDLLLQAVAWDRQLLYNRTTAVGCMVSVPQ